MDAGGQGPRHSYEFECPIGGMCRHCGRSLTRNPRCLAFIGRCSEGASSLTTVHHIGGKADRDTVCTVTTK